MLSAHKPPFASKWCTPFAVTEGESPPDVVLDVEQGGSISGRVVDADGRAAPGIDVSAWSQQGGANDSVSSGPDGTFLLSGLGPGGQQLGAWSQAFGGVNRMLDPPLKPGETREGVELKLVLEVKTVSKLTGVLVEEDGTPVGERYLSAQGAHNSSAWTQTDADGAFTFRGLSEGKATLTLQTQSGDGNWVSAAIPDATFDVPSSGARVVLPRKEPTTVVVGRVLLPHGALVPLCNVTALAAEAKATATSPAVASFSVSGEVIGGEFRREVPAGRAFELIVTGARDADGKPENVLASTTPVTTPAGPLVIRLLSGRSIRGRVLSADGKGIADATVNGSFGSVTSDEDGSFEILGVEADEVSLTVQPIGSYMTPPQPTIAKAGATDVVIRMDSGLAISGRVVDADGNPVESGNVRATPTVGSRLSLHANLDEGGTFRIEHVPRDAVYDIVIRFWGAAGKLSNHKSWTTSGVRSGTEDLVARVDGGEVIRGVVVDGEGQPVPSAWVNASPASGGGATQSAQSDESGRFAVGGLDPGPYVLRASIWNGQQRTSLPASAETGERGVRIVMPNSVKLTGRILADGDKAGFSILVRLAGPLTVDSWPQVAQGQAAADGSFALDVPMDLFLDVQVSRANDDRFGYLGNVKGGTGDVSIALVEGRSIEGTAEDAVGQAVAGNTWVIAKSPTWYAWAAVDAAGAFRFRGLPAGAYRLRMTPVARPNAKPALLDTVAGSTGVRLRLPE